MIANKCVMLFTLVLFVLWCASLFTGPSKTSHTASTGYVNYVASGPANADEAAKFVAGTWTGSEAFGSIVTWLRNDINKDGSFVSYLADAQDKGWETVTRRGRWTINGGKYRDSGRQYIAVTLQWYNPEDGQRYTEILPIEGRRLRSYDDQTGEVALEFTRGDHFPYRPIGLVER